MTREYSYTFDPPTERKRYRRYRRAELERMTTIAFIAVVLFFFASCGELNPPIQEDGEDAVMVSTGIYQSENTLCEDLNPPVQETKGDDTVISVVIYPAHNTFGAYFIQLSSDGVLTTSEGVGDHRVDEYGDSIVEPDFYFETIWETASVELQPDQLQEMLDLVAKITDDDSVYLERAWTDTWYIDVIYFGKVFKYIDIVLYDLSDDPPDELIDSYNIPHMRDLINMLISYSPLKVWMDPFV